MKRTSGGESAKPVAETWFSVDVHDGDILRFREHNIDAYASGDFWLVRGTDRALAVDTGCGIVSPVGLVEAIARRPVTAVALNCSYDHAGGWAGFDARACHPLDAPDLEKPESESASVNDYLNDGTLMALPWEGYDVHGLRDHPGQADPPGRRGRRVRPGRPEPRGLARTGPGTRGDHAVGGGDRHPLRQRHALTTANTAWPGRRRTPPPMRRRSNGYAVCLSPRSARVTTAHSAAPECWR